MLSIFASRSTLPPSSSQLLLSTIARRAPKRNPQSISFVANPSSVSTNKIVQEERYVNLVQVAQASGVRLTKVELQSLRQRFGSQISGFRNSNSAEVSWAKFREAKRKLLDEQWGREVCWSEMEKPHTWWDHVGARLLFFLDIAGKTLFAVVGTQMAGEAGMNIVGCALVGCISSLGGVTLNNLLYGTSHLFGHTGVTWVHNPAVFYLSLAASLTTFYAWPIYCRMEARRELTQKFGDLLEKDLSVSRRSFVLILKRHHHCKVNVQAAVAKKANPKLDLDDPCVLFDLIDEDNSGFIELSEMQALVQHRFNSSSTVYMIDTFALSALSVTAVHMAIARGVAPIIAATSGITICFGGIFRDILCGRPLALGGQSYALATMLGSSVYVLLRGLSLRPNTLNIPVSLRIFLSASTTVAVRLAEYLKEEPLMRPMHYHSSDFVKRRIRRECKSSLVM